MRVKSNKKEILRIVSKTKQIISEEQIFYSLTIKMVAI